MNILGMSLVLILGPMFSGKTTEMGTMLSRFLAIGKRVVIIRHPFDVREFESHNPIVSYGKVFDTIKTDKLLTLDMSKYDVIGIEETQFFDGDIVEFVINMIEKQGKMIIANGLIGNFKREPMGHIHRLIPLADEFTFMRAICMNCKKSEGLFSHRKTMEKDEVAVGGAEKYMAVCRSCYVELNQH